LERCRGGEAVWPLEHAVVVCSEVAEYAVQRARVLEIREKSEETIHSGYYRQMIIV